MEKVEGVLKNLLEINLDMFCLFVKYTFIGVMVFFVVGIFIVEIAKEFGIIPKDKNYKELIDFINDKIKNVD